MGQSINFSNVQRVLFNGADIEHLRLNTDVVWDLLSKVAGFNPYTLDGSIVRVKLGNDVLYKDGVAWKYAADSSFYNPCEDGWSVDYSGLKCSRTVTGTTTEDSGWQHSLSTNTRVLASKFFWDGKYLGYSGWGSLSKDGYIYYHGSIVISGNEDNGYRDSSYIKRVRTVSTTSTETKNFDQV